MGQLFANAAKSTLQAQITDNDLSLTLSGNGSAFPVATRGTGTTGDWFKAVLDDGNNQEVIFVRTHTSGSTSFSNILRGQEGTQARTWPAGTVIGLRLTAEDFTLATGRRTVASVAEMKEIAAPIGSTVETLGYYAPGDGGTTTYRIVAAGTGTQDGGSLITLNNTLQAQALFPGNVVRLSQFGAKGVYQEVSATPTSLGNWVDLGSGVYELNRTNLTTPRQPLRIPVVDGNSYRLTYTKDLSLPEAIDNGYELVGYAGSTLMINQYHQGIGPFSTGIFASTGDFIEIKAVEDAPPLGFVNPGWVRFSNLKLFRLEDDTDALAAALAWFGTSKVGKLIVDTTSYISTNTALTVPDTVDLEFTSGGFPGLSAAVVINSKLIADNRAILPGSASVTFGPRQHTVKPNWFGL